MRVGLFVCLGQGKMDEKSISSYSFHSGNFVTQHHFLLWQISWNEKKKSVSVFICECHPWLDTPMTWNNHLRKPTIVICVVIQIEKKNEHVWLKASLKCWQQDLKWIWLLPSYESYCVSLSISLDWATWDFPSVQSTAVCCNSIVKKKKRSFIGRGWRDVKRVCHWNCATGPMSQCFRLLNKYACIYRLDCTRNPCTPRPIQRIVCLYMRNNYTTLCVFFCLCLSFSVVALLCQQWCNIALRVSYCMLTNVTNAHYTECVQDSWLSPIVGFLFISSLDDNETTGDYYY